jgi:hypothetical protein
MVERQVTKVTVAVKHLADTRGKLLYTIDRYNWQRPVVSYKWHRQVAYASDRHKLVKTSGICNWPIQVAKPVATNS